MQNMNFEENVEYIAETTLCKLGFRTLFALVILLQNTVNVEI